MPGGLAGSEADVSTASAAFDPERNHGCEYELAEILLQSFLGGAMDGNLAQAYELMMHSDAWKDLEKFMLDEKDASMKRVDSKAAADLTIGEVCEERGIRKGILKIFRHINERKNPQLNLATPGSPRRA